ncbi:DUF3035 domain-containing protein [Paracoccus sp. 1_MG-2023]|uniref:DUF3035 domain-containing protein n=1 Tax=unclassified Paracoccus (in: a-proteobacteria) TaxID=2688777 RepID=UPI001C093B18|nr:MULTISPECIES: DUF3035 domain-containing protein [unclassified Paracoccus (in: a-proteobacteria)]MBU2957354.1 DUF3035 domain-containing protein [Paracoccus sp. C2R09]MDO6670117.1 DUF3035 domain-containing protein [Paracoccus sp. 1_MG-2023]
MRKASLILGLAAMTALTACAGGSQLNNFRKVQSGPDEFGILPTKSLSMPPDLAVLPQPTPGGANITDPTPRGDAVAVLGGDPSRLADQGIAASDQALVAHAARQGSDPAIREDLAQKDARWRERNGRSFFERMLGSSVYQRAYDDVSLDAEAEQLRWQRAGAITSTAP